MFYPGETSPGSQPGRVLGCDAWVTSRRRMSLRSMSTFPGWHHPSSYVTGSLQMWTHTGHTDGESVLCVCVLALRSKLFVTAFMLVRKRDSSVSIVTKLRAARVAITFRPTSLPLYSCQQLCRRNVLPSCVYVPVLVARVYSMRTCCDL
jgi:hypothetical protein